MEENTTTQQTLEQEVKVEETFLLNENAVKKLKSITKWSRIFVIVTYVSMAIMFIAMLFFGKFMDKMTYLSGQSLPPNFNSIFYSLYGVVMIVVYFFPLFYLHKFTGVAKRALAEKDEDLMAEALGKQDVFFKIIAWYTIVFTFLALIFFIGFALMMTFVQ